MDAEIVGDRQDLVLADESATVPAKTPRIVLPAILTSAGDDALTRFAEYFTVTIQNPHTRRAYFRNAVSFLRWCEDRGVRDLKAITPMMVAAFLESLKTTHAKPSIKQHLATLRMLGDWLVTGHILATNPAHAVRGPKHVVTKGLTPILDSDETKKLLESIPVTRNLVSKMKGEKVPIPNLIGLRDRALIATMFFTFARVGAVVTMTVADYYPQGKRWWLRLQEKGGKQHDMPAHHTLETYLDAYVKAAGIADDPKGPLFRSAPGTQPMLMRKPLSTADVWRMIQRRTKAAGIQTKIGCHSFRATGITNYLTNDGTLEKAQQMAAHASPRTTKLYDRTNDQVSLDEVEKIRL